MNRNVTIALACPLTSSPKGYLGTVPVIMGGETGLTKDSEVLVFQVRALSRERFKKRLGVASQDTLVRVVLELNKICQL